MTEPVEPAAVVAGRQGFSLSQHRQKLDSRLLPRRTNSCAAPRLYSTPLHHGAAGVGGSADPARKECAQGVPAPRLASDSGITVVSALCTALERAARIKLRRLRPAPEAWRRNRLRRGCRLGPHIRCLWATIRVDGRTSAARGSQGLSQTFQSLLPKPDLDSGIRRRRPTVPGCLRNRTARPHGGREGVSLRGRGRQLLAALSNWSGDVFRCVPSLAGKRRGSRPRFRCVGGFDGCVQRQDRSLELDSIENPLDVLARPSGVFQLSPQSVHNVSIRHP
jgi:hypothetical protein